MNNNTGEKLEFKKCLTDLKGKEEKKKVVKTSKEW